MSNDYILPQPTMSALGEIEHIIAEASHSIFLRDKVVSHIVNTNYLEQLFALHETCEDLDATEELHQLYNIMRQAILLNDSLIFESIIKDEHIIGVVSLLEHDPQQHVERGTFRNFLRGNARYKEVVPIDDVEMESKIHQTFRLQYLKDVVLPRILDDGTLPIINALIYFNHAQIANYLQHNERLLKDLFGLLHKSEDAEKKRDVVYFVRQFCSLARSLPVSYRIGLYRTLGQYGMFAVFEYALSADNDMELQAAGADVILSALEQDRALVRSYAMGQSRQQHDNPNLIDLVIQGIQRHIGSEVQIHCCEIMRIILDVTQPPLLQQHQQQPPTQDALDVSLTSGDRPGRDACESSMDDFIAMFYGAFAHSTMEPLLALTVKSVQAIGSKDKCIPLLLFLCETLSTCVRFHGYRARSFVFASDVAKNVVLLLDAKPNYLKLAALRFIRVCVGVQDDSYNKYLVGHRLFDPVIELFLQVHSRDNLISSACRELFKFIAINRIALLLSHLTNVHSKTLGPARETLEMLRQAYVEHLAEVERIKSGGSEPSTPIIISGGRRKSAVSINSLTDRELQRVQGNNGAAGHDIGPEQWVGGSAADEMEDAYLEASDLDDSIDVVDSQSPELKGLQDCLVLYSDATTEAIKVADTTSADNPAVSQPRTPDASPPPLLKKFSSTDGNLLDASRNNSAVLTIADAFPDSKPVAGRRRLMGTKRAVIGGMHKGSLFRNSNGSATSSSEIGSAAAAMPPLGKRGRTMASGIVHMEQNARLVSLSNDGQGSQTTRASCSNGGVRLQGSKALSSPNGAVGMVGGSTGPSDNPSPPKKAKTASL
ncbi:Platinum sensitivity protein [Kickxella alabastrina]|nr:Platinum sensitivity protein [Kickxella alabastrina]